LQNLSIRLAIFTSELLLAVIAGGGYVQLADSGYAAGLLPGLDSQGPAFARYVVALHARGRARATRNRVYGILVRPGRVLTMSL